METMKQPELGKRIASLRKGKGLTQEELVDMCNINVRTIQRIESGEVTPRASTIKLILDVLGYDYQTFDEEEKTTSMHSFFSIEKLSEFFLIDFDSRKNISTTSKQLKLAFFAALLNFFLGFIISGFEHTIYEKWLNPDNYAIYTIIKLINFVAFIFLQRGFIIIADYFENSLLKILSYIIIIHETFNAGYTILSLYLPSIDSQYIDSGISITIGAILIIYSISIKRLKTYFGKVSNWAAVFIFISGFFLLTLILWWVGLIFLIPFDILEIIIIFKSLEYIKKEHSNKTI